MAEGGAVHKHLCSTHKVPEAGPVSFPRRIHPCEQSQLLPPHRQETGLYWSCASLAVRQSLGLLLPSGTEGDQAGHHIQACMCPSISVAVGPRD